MAALRESSGGPRKGPPENTAPLAEKPVPSLPAFKSPPTLADLGVTKKESAEAQQLARHPPESIARRRRGPATGVPWSLVDLPSVSPMHSGGRPEVFKTQGTRDRAVHADGGGGNSGSALGFILLFRRDGKRGSTYRHYHQ